MVKLNVEFLFRKKKFTNESVTHTNLSRVLGLLDVTTIGISATLGAGIYILGIYIITKYSFLAYIGVAHYHTITIMDSLVIKPLH